MYYQSDTVMRMIESLGQLLRRLLGLTEEQRLEEAAHLLRDAMHRLTGVELSVARALPAERLFYLIGTGEPARTLAAARVMCMQADLDDGLLCPEEGAALRQKALEVYLRLGPEGGGYVVEHVEVLRGRGIPADPHLLMQFYESVGSFARAEDALDAALTAGTLDEQDARAFYARLLALSDGTLVRGGLPRGEVLEGMDRFR